MLQRKKKETEYITKRKIITKSTYRNYVNRIFAVRVLLGMNKPAKKSSAEERPPYFVGTIRYEIKDAKTGVQKYKPYKYADDVTLEITQKDKIYDISYSFISNYKKVIQAIESNAKWADSTIFTTYSALIFFAKFNNMTYKTVQAYQVKMNKYDMRIKKQLKKNEPTAKQKENLLEWESFLSIGKKIKIAHDVEINLRNKKRLFNNLLLVSLYTLFPPRRVLDYSAMRYYSKFDLKHVSPSNDTNYCIGDGNKMKFHFYAYKTNYHHEKNKKGEIIIVYDDQFFNVNTRLRKIIMHWVKMYKVHDGDYLVNASKKQTAPNAFSVAMSRVFKRYTDKVNITVNTLRHSFINHLIKKGVSDAVREKYANMMSHSQKTSDSYRKRMKKKIFVD
jgi:hypothetical protein